MKFKLNIDSFVKESATVELGADINQVFRFVATDFCENYPRWSPDIEKLEPLSDGPVTVDSEFRLVRKEGEETVESIIRVTEIEDNHRFSLESLTDPYEMSLVFEGREAPPRTKLTFIFHLRSIEVVMRPFVKLIKAALRDGAKQSVENVKSLVGVSG